MGRSFQSFGPSLLNTIYPHHSGGATGGGGGATQGSSPAVGDALPCRRGRCRASSGENILLLLLFIYLFNFVSRESSTYSKADWGLKEAKVLFSLSSLFFCNKYGIKYQHIHGRRL